MENTFKEELTYEEVIKQLQPVLDEIEKIRYDNDCLDRPKNLPESRFTNMVFSKLNAILRKQKMISDAQAPNVYSDWAVVHQKMCEILDLIDYINNNGNVIYIIDKQTVCAYLRINVPTYQFMLTDATVDEEVQQEFKSMEEMLISSMQQGAETKLRDNQAVSRRLLMDGKFGGNDVEFHKRKDSTVIEGTVDMGELKKRIETIYNFGLIEEKPKK